jgi:hypothetical protein
MKTFTEATPLNRTRKGEKGEVADQMLTNHKIKKPGRALKNRKQGGVH